MGVIMERVNHPDMSPGDWMVPLNYQGINSNVEDRQLYSAWLLSSVGEVIAAYNRQLAQSRHEPFELDVASNSEQMTASPLRILTSTIF